MPDHHIGRMHGVHQGAFRVKGTSKLWQRWVIDAFDVAIPVRAATDCPLAFRMQHADRWLEWRLVDGVLMREMIDEKGLPMGADGLERRFRTSDWTAPTPFFPDHPENLMLCDLDPQHASIGKANTRDFYETEQAFGGPFKNWIADERERAENRVQDFARDSMAVVDGVLYRRALEPVIRLSWSLAYPANRMEIAITGQVPELRDTLFHGAAWLRADEIEAAEAAVEKVVDDRIDNLSLKDKAFFVRPERPLIEITGAHEPTLETHQVAVPTLNRLLSDNEGPADGHSTSMAASALKLASRHPIIEEPTLTTAEAWDVLTMAARHPAAKGPIRDAISMHQAVEHGRTLAQSTKDLSGFAI